MSVCHVHVMDDGHHAVVLLPGAQRVPQQAGKHLPKPLNPKP